MKLLIIDNYDSFTFNLYQFCGEIFKKLPGQHEIVVKRNDELSLEDAKKIQPDRIIISPGPGSPADPAYFGICSEVILEMGKTIPLLGVCLGMQGICHVFGGEVIHAKLPMHGKLSAVYHENKGVYNDLPQGIEIMRYHSLVVRPSSLPDSLRVTSFVSEKSEDFDSDCVDFSSDFIEIMGVQHKEFPIQGIQFHPESFGTEGGKQMIQNFLLQS